MISADGMSAEGFNRLYPVGTPVTAFTSGRTNALRTRTSSPAWNAGIGNPVVSVEGRTGHLPLTEICINPSEEYTEGEEKLLTPETVYKVSVWLDGLGVYSKGYSRFRFEHGNAQTIGWRVGDKGDQVVALWGDTLVRRPDGTFTVRRIIPARRADLFLRELTDNELEDKEAAEEAAEEMWLQDREARCPCPSPQPDEYTLSIECSAIEVVHTPCTKRPWFMFDDFNEVVSMEDIPIRVDQITGCSGGQCYGGSCDCGPEVYLAPRKEEK